MALPWFPLVRRKPGEDSVTKEVVDEMPLDASMFRTGLVREATG